MTGLTGGVRRMARTFGATAAVGVSIALSGTVARSQSQPPGPPPRLLDSATARTTEPMRAISGVRALSDGRVLINDGTLRRVLLFDSTLTDFKVVADSALGSRIAYGTRVGGLLPFKGDSSLLIDGASLSMLVIDPDGEIARVKAVPRSEHATYLSSTAYGIPGFDAAGRMVYRINPRFSSPLIVAGGGVQMPEEESNAPIVRVDLATRTMDTAAFVNMGTERRVVTQLASGGYTTRIRMQPLPLVDDWAITSDGMIAIVRGLTYHVDWVAPDRSVRSTPRMPFDWQRLDDDYKEAFIDSLRTAMEASRQASYERTTALIDSIMRVCFSTPDPKSGPATPRPAGATGAGRAGGAAGISVVGGVPVTGSAGPGAARAEQPCPPTPPVTPIPPAPIYMVDASELPDYRPPISSGSVRADADGNLWIRTIPMKPVRGLVTYDIVNRDGVLFDRVQIPTTRTPIGFGPGGVVYLSVRDASGLHLEKVRWR